MSTAIQKIEPSRASHEIESIRALAEQLYRGGLTPNGVTKPEHLVVRIVAGAEVGLKPIQAIKSIMVLHGNPSIWGDAALALVRSSGLLEWIRETHEGEGDERTAVCVTKRRGEPEPRETRFSMADAKRSGLLGRAKEGSPWLAYPDRQLMWRARSWNLRDSFGDVLSGLGVVEEEQDRVEVRQVATRESESATVTTTEAGQPKAAIPTVAEAMATEEDLEKLAIVRPTWLKAKGIDLENGDATKAAWLEVLKPYGVATASKLTKSQAAELYRSLVEVGYSAPVSTFLNPPANAATSEASVGQPQADQSSQESPADLPELLGTSA